MYKDWKGSRQSGGIYFRMTNSTPNHSPKIFAAIALILVGVAFFLNNIGIIHVYNLWDYWPLVLIVVGVFRLQASRGEPDLLRGGIEIVVGVLFQLHNLGMLPIRAGILWPLALIVGGVVLLLRPEIVHFQGRLRTNLTPGDIENQVNEVAIFGGVKRAIGSRNFQGGSLFSMFGGIELDLRGAEIPLGSPEVVLEANAVFGGIDIKVSDRWRVAVRGAGVFGGYEDKTLSGRQAAGPNAPLLIVSGSAVFGGVSVE